MRRNIDLENAVPVRLDVANGGEQRESDAGRALDHAEPAHQFDLHAVVSGVDLVSGDAGARLAVFQCGVEPSAGRAGAHTPPPPPPETRCHPPPPPPAPAASNKTSAPTSRARPPP